MCDVLTMAFCSFAYSCIYIYIYIDIDIDMFYIYFTWMSELGLEVSCSSWAC